MPWLGQAWQRIQQRLADDRLPHALVIAGERGVGKRAFADALARLRLCDRPAPGPGGHWVPCGQCKQCELTAAGSHPDVRVYAPEKSRMVKVSQVRELSAFAVASPQVAHHKVAIIDRADQLNINAANALLKTLEEPQADTTLLLVQEAGRPLLPTIRSRCQVVALPLPAMDEAQAWIERQSLPADSGDGAASGEASARSDAIQRALLLSGRAPRLALEYLTGDFIGLRDAAFEAFRQFMKGQVPVTEAARAFKALGLEATLTLFEQWAADLARLSAGGEPRDPDAADMLRFLAGRHPPWAAQHLLDAVREARAAGVYNANPELEASRLLFAWQALMPGRRAG